jgi:hypothetical protein
MGRPKKDIDQKLSKVIVIRVTNSELKKLEQLSIMCGQHLAVLIRKKLFAGNYPKAITPKVTVQLYAELNRIGVNLNQLTRHINSGMLPSGLIPLLNELTKQEQAIINHLLNDRG